MQSIRRPALRAVVAIACLGCGTPAIAHEQEQKRVLLDHLVIRGKRVEPERLGTNEEALVELRRTPGGVAVVGEEELRDSRGANLDDALGFVPGVFVRPRFGAADESQLSIRGSGLRNNFHLRGVNVLIDGFPYGNADGFSDFEALEVLTAKRIEVLKGANALRYGANSLGGAVNLVTRTGRDAPLVELRSEGGSFGFQKHYGATGAAFSGGRGPSSSSKEAELRLADWGRFDAYAAFSDTELDGYRDHAEQARRRLYATLGWLGSTGAAARFDVAYAENGETLPGSLTREELEADPKAANPEDVAADAQRDYDYARMGTTLHVPLGERQSIESAAHANVQDQFHPLSFAILTGDTVNWGVETRWTSTADLLGRENRLTAGLQYQDTRQEDVRFDNLGGARKGGRVRDQTNAATNVGLYVEEESSLTPALAVVVGARIQWDERSVENDRVGEGERPDDSTDFIGGSPKVGFVWSATETVQLFGNASHAFEPPLLLELTAPAAIGGSLDELDPQRAWQFELGTRGGRGETIQWDVAVFDAEIRDEIRNVNVQPFPDASFTIPRYTNVERSRHTGVEVGGAARLFSGLFADDDDRLEFRAAYTWSRFVFVDDPEFGGNRLPGAPDHFLRAELRYDHPAGFWLAPGTESVPQGYAVNSENTAENDRYALFGVRAGWNVEGWRLSLFVEGRNLLDEVYASSVQVDNALGRFFEPGDGRAFYGGLQWRWS